MSCSWPGGSLPGAGGGPTRGSGGVGSPGRGGRRPGRNMITTGTRRASAGVTRTRSIATSIAGCAELSARPSSFLATTGRPATVVSTVSATVHVTFGTLAGMRP